MDWKFEKNMYPILDTRVKCKVEKIQRTFLKFSHFNRNTLKCKVSITLFLYNSSSYFNRNTLKCKSKRKRADSEK